VAPSILYPDSADGPPGPLPDRHFATDLNLDQVFAAINKGREDLDLWPVFYTPLRRLDDVAFRHEVLADLRRPPILAALRDFGEAMRQTRLVLTTTRSLSNTWQRERHFVDAVAVYCDAVRSLASALPGLGPHSRAMGAVTGYLSGYCSSPGFAALADGAREIVTVLGAIRYSLHIKGNRVTINPYRGEPDYTSELAAVVARFTEDAATDYTAKFRSPLHMNSVEVQVLDLVARLNPGPFGAMHEYFDRHQGFVDPVVSAFDRDSQFYLAYLDFIEPLRIAGLPFCYPVLSTSPGPVRAQGAFDLALAATAAPGRSPARGVVTNDFDLSPAERVVVVTGPNNGGKTTFARTFGQIHYLASLGLPVPARAAELVLADGVFTSFQQAERLGTLRGHLEEELVHIHDIIQRATPRSVIVMNESFSSTTLSDAALLGRAVFAQLVERGSLCAFVTFVDELAAPNEATVSMSVTVHPDDPVLRTYKVVRKAPEGRAYAAALAERYGLTYGAVEQQVAK
jgi:DNA mismatch repair protein MutS